MTMTLNVSDVHRNTEIRKLPLSVRRRMTEMLDPGDIWKDLAAVACKPDTQEPAFLPSDIPILEKQRSPTEVLLNHWGTLGTRHANVDDLLSALKLAKLYRAADYILLDVLKAPPEPRVEDHGPTDVIASLQSYGSAALADTRDVAATSNNVNMASGGPVKPDVAPFLPVPQYTYLHLKQVTSDFGNEALLGEGAFGAVYQGKLAHGQLIAVKRMKSPIERQFITELEVMCKFVHENLLPLIGYCFDGPLPCLVYAYMSNGSLDHRLACLNDTPAIPWIQRVNMAIYVARGLCYLHTFKDGPLVHRDVKSANILLDDDMTPKIGDFGLVRLGNSGDTHTIAVTKVVLGTPTYMAPEAYHGDVSVKLDVFSFGIIMFELLSALPPYDEDNEIDLLTYVMEEVKELEEMLDIKAGDWDKNVANSLFELAKQCTEYRKKDRPTMTEVLSQLEGLLQR